LALLQAHQDAAKMKMRLKMKKQENQFPPELLNVTIALANSLSTSEPFLLYQQAQTRLNNDSNARFLLENIAHAQSTLRKKQAKNEVERADIDQLRALQKEAQENTVIMEYSQAQQKAVACLREINTEISQLIGINFASLARRSSCC
jgi:cell fate (sporulation/competence/biofilm development) regulator YlbF (YheA/YmcA/DUF963 family)